MIARSWGAGLRSSGIDVSRTAAATVVGGIDVRELTPDDVVAALALDAATIDDYPGDIATAHTPLTEQSATPRPERRAWGAFAGTELLAMTYVDVAGEAANRALGYELDEEWWTLAAPRRPGDGSDEPA